MVKYLLNGCYGKMGQEVAKAASNSKFSDLKLVAGIYRQSALDTHKLENISNNITEHIEESDVVLDFSTVEAAVGAARLCAQYKKAFVSGTTGFTTAQNVEFEKLAKVIPIFLSANMCIGINIISKLISDAARLLDDSYDCEILEMHHNQKLDAPSGTALMLGRTVANAKGKLLNEPIDLERNNKRLKGDIGFACLRGGSVVGEHSVIFAGLSDVITVSHKALDRSLFASGALSIVRWISTKPAGYYSMNDFMADNTSN